MAGHMLISARQFMHARNASALREQLPGGRQHGQPDKSGRDKAISNSHRSYRGRFRNILSICGMLGSTVGKSDFTWKAIMPQGHQEYGEHLREPSYPVTLGLHSARPIMTENNQKD
jgi:hypothetical protein